MKFVFIKLSAAPACCCCVLLGEVLPVYSSHLMADSTSGYPSGWSVFDAHIHMYTRLKIFHILLNSVSVQVMGIQLLLNSSSSSIIIFVYYTVQSGAETCFGFVFHHSLSSYEQIGRFGIERETFNYQAD